MAPNAAFFPLAYCEEETAAKISQNENCSCFLKGKNESLFFLDSEQVRMAQKDTDTDYLPG